MCGKVCSGLFLFCLDLELFAKTKKKSGFPKLVFYLLNFENLHFKPSITKVFLAPKMRETQWKISLMKSIHRTSKFLFPNETQNFLCEKGNFETY